MATKQNQYLPETVSHPGETLLERLEELGIGSKEFAIRTSKPEKTISKIISGQSAITPDMAVLFEDVLQIPANFWLTRQKQFDEAVARIKRASTIATSINWAKAFPYAKMASFGWVPSTRKIDEKVSYLFKYFGIATQQAFEDYYFNEKLKVSFRMSLAHTKMPYAFASWVRQGEIQSQSINAPNYDSKKLTDSLPQIKSLMANHPVDFFSQLQQICLQAGVKLVYTPCLPGAQLHGCTRWLKDTPLIQMSARYKQNDIFWFTFFHELAHILLHGKKHISLETVGYDTEQEVKEKEADDFAISWTFTEAQEKEVLAAAPLMPMQIEEFAKKFETHPAMIIGRFHHKGLIPFSMGREFIEKVEIE